MPYRCLICNVVVNSPDKLEAHLKIEHKWGKQRDSKGVMLDPNY